VVGGMRIHCVQHVPYEGMGAIAEWVRERGHLATETAMFRALPIVRLPETRDFDFLVMVGGPMNVYQYDEYPWLSAERTLIRAAVDSGKAVLGICLGAQLIADVLGGPVTKGVNTEIGWYPVELTETGRAQPVFADFPPRFTALHWHGDTFAVPPGATHAASSAACANQAFALDGGRVVGLQFHLEETRDSLTELVENAGDELADGPAAERAHVDRAPTGPQPATARPWVASREELLAPDVPFAACRQLLFSLLDRMVATIR